MTVSDETQTDRIAITTRGLFILIYWWQVTHICVSKLTLIGSDKGLVPGKRQATIWTNAGILFIGHMGTNFNKISIDIHIFSFKQTYFKMSSGKCRRCCLCLNVLGPYLLNFRKHHGVCGLSFAGIQHQMTINCYVHYSFLWESNIVSKWEIWNSLWGPCIIHTFYSIYYAITRLGVPSRKTFDWFKSLLLLSDAI